MALNTSPPSIRNHIGGLPLRLLIRYFRAEWSGALLAILILGISIELVTDGRPFFSPSNLFTILNNSAALGIVAAGMTLVILTAGIDLSVGSVMGMCAALTGYVVSYVGMPPLMAMAFGLGCGAAVGMLHGSLVAYFGMPAFIVTLAGLSVWRGTGHLATEAQATPKMPEIFNYLGRHNPLKSLRDAYKAGELEGIWASIGSILDTYWLTIFRTFQMSTILLVVVFVILGLIVSNTKYGRYVYAVGSSPSGARQAGIPTSRYITLTYVICSACAAFGALLFLGRAPYAKSDYGVMWELDAIAAVVIGGTSLFGGRGSLWGTFMGVILLKLINNGLTLAQLNTFWQMVVTGLIIVLAVSLDIVRQSHDPVLIRRFLAALAAGLAFMAFLTPGSLWITAQLTLREHVSMVAMRESGAALAPGQAQRIISPAEIDALSAQAEAATWPSLALLMLALICLAAFWRNTPLFLSIAAGATAFAVAVVLLAGLGAVAPFLILALCGLAGALAVVPIWTRAQAFARST